MEVRQEENLVVVEMAWCLLLQAAEGVGQAEWPAVLALSGAVADAGSCGVEEVVEPSPTFIYAKFTVIQNLCKKNFFDEKNDSWMMLSS